ncbi:MAG: hypothetical protein U1E76_27260 [Planctomycetota bacterium]
MNPCLLVLVASALLACSGGGGGGGAFTVVGSSFGYDPITGKFTGTGTNGESPRMPKNSSLLFRFASSIDPDSVSSETVVVQAFDPDTGNFGKFAAVTYDVRGADLIVSPLITFTEDNVSFGFEDNQDYQIVFEGLPGPTVRSRSGKALETPLSYRFFTTDQVFDNFPGAPRAEIHLIDQDTEKEIGTTNVPIAPPPLVVIDFSEPVFPPSAVNGNTGTSNTIRVELDLDGNESTASDRVTIPGLFTLTETDSSAQVTFRSSLRTIPTAPSGCLYVITVDGLVADLTGNTLVEETGDPDAKTVLTFTTVPGDSSGKVDPLVEEFDKTTFENQTLSSAAWGTRFPGFLSFGIGGGSGADEAFDPEDAAFVERWDGAPDRPEIDVDTPNKRVTMNTDSGLAARVFQFTSIRVPAGWVVAANGSHPLLVRATANVKVLGTITVPGKAAEVFPENRVHPGAAGAAFLGGEAGGAGASVTDGINLNVPLFVTPPPSGFADPPSGTTTFGLSGRSTLIDTDPLGGDGYELQDLSRDFSLIANLTNLWVQPNVPSDDDRYVRWHPTFKIKLLKDSHTIRVVDDPADPDYFGRLTDPSNNPWLGPDFQPAPIAETGDPYLIGDLVGHGGTANGTYGGGKPSRAQTVTQTFLTLARCGGGGGGGSQRAGENGQDDTTLPYDPDAPYGGEGTLGGAGGAAATIGTVDAVPNNTTLIDNGAFTGLTLTDYVVNPDTNQSLLFEVASNDANSLVIREVVDLDGNKINLADVPGLGPGSSYRLSPPWSKGGAGGSGSSVHCAGSTKTSAPYSLPDWAPGAGGGGGGGVLHLECGGNLSVTAVGRLLAEGGAGGYTTGNPATSASGGGGGGGGTILIQVGGTVRITTGGLISAAGGAGKQEGQAVGGGQGGGGRLRFENGTGDMSPSAFSGVTDPPIGGSDLGKFFGGTESLAQSLYLATGVLVPIYTGIRIEYTYQVEGNPDTQKGAYELDENGVVVSAGFNPPPFTIAVSGVAGDPKTGLPPTPDPNPLFFDPAKAPSGPEDGVVKDLNELRYVRFRMVIPRR